MKEPAESRTIRQSVNETICSHFEAAWHRGEPTPIEDLLPAKEDPQYLDTLEELVHIELELAWERSFQSGKEGESEQAAPPLQIEDYLQRFDLLAAPDRLVRLLRQEYVCRHRYGDRPSIEGYCSRFPHLPQLEEELQKSKPPEVPRKTKVEPLEPGDRVDQYVVVKEHAHGGFGAVWRADDARLNRQIALKELSPELAADKEQRERFFHEAGITARLEHPGIVPVYDVGGAEASSAFYTMKLVRGDTLAEAIDHYHKKKGNQQADNIEQLRLINALLSVVRTMDYSHAKNVIHRDLKPQNVILGRYGETIVLDWGLAKVVEEDLPQTASDFTTLKIKKTDFLLESSGNTPALVTMPGTVQGTPAYMAPEQATGQTDRVDHRSDIYAVGVMFYQLLTGKIPFTGKNAYEVLEKVAEGAAISPRAIDKTIPKPLEAICLKAMARRRSHRYQAMSALREDIERYLADEPVEALAEPWGMRMARWLRQNRTAVAGGVATLLVGMIILSISVVMLSAANRSERSATSLAEERAAEAKRESDRAEQNFSMAKDAVDRFLTGFAEDPRLASEEMIVLNRKSLAHAQEVYEQFVDQKSTDPVIQAELGRTYVRLAILARELGEPAKAKQLHAQASHWIALALASEPHNPEFRFRKAENLNALCVSETRAGEYEEAELAGRQGVAISQEVVEAAPDNEVYKSLLADSQTSLARVLYFVGRFAESEEEYRAAEALLREHVGEDPFAYDRQLQLAHVLNRQGILAHKKGEISHAEKVSSEAFRILEQVPKNQMTLASYYDRYSRYTRNLVACYDYNWIDNTLVMNLEKSVQMRRDLVALYPSISSYRREFAASLSSLARFRLWNNRTDDALALYQEAIDTLRTKEGSPPLAVEHRFWLIGAMQGKAGALHRKDMQGNREAILAIYEEIQDIHSGIEQEVGNDLQSLAKLAQSYESLAHIYYDTGQFDLAEEAVDHEFILYQRIVDTFPEVEFYKNKFATALYKRAQLADEANQVELLESHITQSIKIREALIEDWPDVVPYSIDLIDAYLFWGFSLQRRGQHQEAEALYKKAVDLGDPHLLSFWETTSFVVWVSRANLCLASTSIEQGNEEEAKELVQKAISQSYFAYRADGIYHAIDYCLNRVNAHPKEESNAACIMAFSEIAVICTEHYSEESRNENPVLNTIAATYLNLSIRLAEGKAYREAAEAWEVASPYLLPETFQFYRVHICANIDAAAAYAGEGHYEEGALFIESLTPYAKYNADFLIKVLHFYAIAIEMVRDEALEEEAKDAFIVKYRLAAADCLTEAAANAVPLSAETLQHLLEAESWAILREDENFLNAVRQYPPQP